MNSNKAADPAITRSNKTDAVYTAVQYSKILEHTKF